MAEAQEAIAKINAWMDHFGLTVKDLGRPQEQAKPRKTPARAAVKKGRKQKIRYSDGNGNTWSGQGSTPRWITDSGKPKEKFRLPD